MASSFTDLSLPPGENVLLSVKPKVFLSKFRMKMVTCVSIVTHVCSFSGRLTKAVPSVHVGGACKRR